MTDTTENTEVTEQRTLGDISHQHAVQATKAFFQEIRETQPEIGELIDNMDQAERMAMMVRIGICLDGFINHAMAVAVDEIMFSIEQQSKAFKEKSEENAIAGLQNLTKTFD